MKRRHALSLIGSLFFSSKASAFSHSGLFDTPAQEDAAYGCLVDTTLCVGCRECEKACKTTNNPTSSPTDFNDQSIFSTQRRTDADNLTVVNRHEGQPSSIQEKREDTYVKVQCMHCQDPSCVSACIVGALQKKEAGAVIYDEDRCIGCRYCLVACPFQIPAYEYHEPIAPRVRKCSFCFENTTHKGEPPACASACPREAIVFGKRQDLIEMAKQKINENPGRYINHIYGEKEVGGTSWMYLAVRPFEELDFPVLEEDAPPRLTESIQHGVFKYGLPPALTYGALGGLMYINQRRNQVKNDETENQEENHQ